MQTRQRSTAAVINDHLRLRTSGDLEQDLARNISADVVILARTGVSRGHAGVRGQAAALSRYAGHEEFDYGSLLCEGEFAYLEWSATSRDGRRIHDGADGFVVRSGQIIAQTIHYTPVDVRRGSRHGPEEAEHVAAPEQLDHGFDEGFGARERTPSQRRVGRFSDGIEHDPDATGRRGRFSQGAEDAPDDPRNAVERRFSEGIEGKR
jgi:hypothetical protein